MKMWKTIELCNLKWPMGNGNTMDLPQFYLKRGDRVLLISFLNVK